MLRSSLSRAVLVILLLLVAVPSLQAAEPGGPSVSWSFLARTWGFLTSAWGNNGCSLDPSGLCLPGQQAAAPLDNGCSLDPDGRCLAGQQAVVPADNGCEADPNGRCRN